MKPAPFEYVRPKSIPEAIALLEKHGSGARPLAGGQSLVPMLAMRLSRPDIIVDLNNISELSSINISDGNVHIGALTRYSQVNESPLIFQKLPLLHEAVQHIGDRMIRNRGTVGGSLAHAEPSAEIPLVAIAMDASVLAISSQRGSRRLRVSSLFKGPYQTCLADDELITDTIWPAHADSASSFLELTRRHGDFPVISVAAYGIYGPGDTWSSINLALGGISEVPVLCQNASNLLAGSRLTSSLIEEAASTCLAACTISSDTRASKEYRIRILPVYVRRVLQRLQESRG